MSVQGYSSMEESQPKHINVEYKLQKYLGTHLPTVNTLEDLIKELYKVFEEDSVNVEHVNYLMRSYKSVPKEWKKYAKFDRYR